MPEQKDAPRIWTKFETAHKLHIRRMQRGPAIALCGYMPQAWVWNPPPVVDPDSSECCKRCLAISKRRKRDWPRG